MVHAITLMAPLMATNVSFGAVPTCVTTLIATGTELRPERPIPRIAAPEIFLFAA